MASKHNEKRFIQTLGATIIEDVFIAVDITTGAASNELTIVSTLANPTFVQMFPINGESTGNDANSVIKLNGKTATFKSGFNTSGAIIGQIGNFPEIDNSNNPFVTDDENPSPFYSACIRFIQIHSTLAS